MHETRDLGVHYREAAASDVPSLAHLRHEGEAGGASEERIARHLAGEHHPQQALPPRVMLMAAAAESPVGYIAGHLTRRYACDGELQWVYVRAEYRGKGVAPALLRLLADWFLEREARRICVDVGDEHARTFYRRYGADDLNEHWMVWADIGVVASGSAR